jgi:hypothetical protein
VGIEHAIRLAVNIAMYVLCSNYKDDQVHAPLLDHRRVVLQHQPGDPSRPLDMADDHRSSRDDLRGRIDVRGLTRAVILA